jgi:hypothetical protein
MRLKPGGISRSMISPKVMILLMMFSILEHGARTKQITRTTRTE